jgi:hypothetical protein
MRAVSLFPPGALNRLSSTLVAFSEKSAKFTPLPSQVAPRGDGFPGHTFIRFSLTMSRNFTPRAARWKLCQQLGDVPPHTVMGRNPGRAFHFSPVKCPIDLWLPLMLWPGFASGLAYVCRRLCFPHAP